MSKAVEKEISLIKTVIKKTEKRLSKLSDDDRELKGVLLNRIIHLNQSLSTIKTLG